MSTVPMLGMLLVLPALPQDPPPDARQDVKPVDAVAVQLSDQEARAAIAAFNKTARDKKARLAQRVEAVHALGQGQHKLLVKPLAAVAQQDTSMTVRKAAAQLLGRQPGKEARAALVKLIEVRDQEPEVLAALITSLSTAGYTSGDWKKLEGLFERDFNEKYTAVQKALLELVTAHKEKQAWKLLLEHIDEPQPEEIADLSNPPADYWERRWKAWRIWRSDAKEALFVITGQRFSGKQEAKIWIRENGAKVGLK